MRSKNQEVDPLFAPFITKVFSIQRIFRVLRNSFFQNKRPFLQHSLRLRMIPALPDRLSLKADPSASVKFIVLDKLTSAWYITHYANAKTKTTNRKQRPIPAGMRTCCYPQKGLCGVQVRTDKIRSRHEMSCS